MRLRIMSPLAGALAAVLLLATAGAAGEKYVTFGADTSPAERQELARIFGVDPSTQAAVVTTAEMVQALQGTGLPAAPTDKSISSSVLTCLNRGDGLTVRTQNITRIPAPVYANALVTAGVGDGDVLIAAPSGNPVTGETALVGVLKGFPQCQAGRQPEPARVRLAYEQIAQTVDLAGPAGDLTRASNILLRAAQPVITGEATDDAAILRALDQAAAAEGIALPPEERGRSAEFLKRLGGVDYGTYARGYQVQQSGPDQVRVLPAGQGAPDAAAQGANQGSGQGANTPAQTGGEFRGEVTRTGEALAVRTDDGERPVAVTPNVVVTRDGRTAQLSDIRRGDDVRVTTNPDGSVRRVDATSDDGGNRWEWLAPLLLLALLPLLFLFGRRRRRAPVAPAPVVQREELVVAPAAPVTVHQRRVVHERRPRRHEEALHQVTDEMVVEPRHTDPPPGAERPGPVQR